MGLGFSWENKVKKLFSSSLVMGNKSMFSQPPSMSARGRRCFVNLGERTT